MENVNSEIASLVQKGSYAEAIELIGEADKRSASEKPSTALYVKALCGLADRGMTYYKARDYKRARATFKYVIQHMPDDGSVEDNIRYSAEQIRSLMKTSEDKMMQQGLMKYRSGNLGDAITIWKEILKLNPGRTEAKKALETATIQLKNLKKIENK